MWLVRTEVNHVLQVLGPFPKDRLCQMIQEGELGPSDEVCEANNYWIFLHETDEVVRQLGIQPPRSLRGEEETTETQTQTKTETDLEATDPDLMPGAPPEEAQAPPDSRGPSKNQDGENQDGATMMFRTGAPAPVAAAAPAAVEQPLQIPSPPSPETLSPLQPLTQATPYPLTGSAPGAPLPPGAPGTHIIYRPMVLGDIQRPNPWRIVLGVLAVVAIAALVLILLLLKKV